MPRKKKSRKVGQIGTPKTSTNKRPEKEKRIRKPKGKPAGNRNTEVKNTTESSGTKTPKDPRHGSKKPVDLFAKPQEKSIKQPSKKYFSPEKELEAIEQDQTLADLLNQLDNNKKLTKDQQHYVDQKLARHKELCAMLGIEEESEEAEQTLDDFDAFDSFESISIDDYKD
jgi:ribosome assembly protein YihI (activator of Der GTPase)